MDGGENIFEVFCVFGRFHNLDVFSTFLDVFSTFSDDLTLDLTLDLIVDLALDLRNAKTLAVLKVS